MRILVTGWFSFEQCNVTAGDLLARDLLCEWLETAELPHDIAMASTLPGGVDWRQADPQRYTHLIFVCGPFPRSSPGMDLLDRFGHCAKVGVNLSMIEALDAWNPFGLLIERDSDAAVRPDLSFGTTLETVPVVGLLRVHPQKEYGELAAHQEANAAIHRLLAAREAAVVPIDTRLEENTGGLRTAREIESLIARMDLVVTTRLHGMVLALKHGVPAVAIDAIRGGAKVSKQAAAVRWSQCFRIDEVTDEQLLRAYDYCLTAEASGEAIACAVRARESLRHVERMLLRGLTAAPTPSLNEPSS